MHTKIINPSNNNSPATYNNKASAARCINYISKKEASKDASKNTSKEISQKTSKQPSKHQYLFNQSQDQISKRKAIQHINNNIKGLKEQDDKFTSLVLSPSEEELKHIQNDAKKLQDYTKACMENYAQNFNLPSGKKLRSEDLVWYACIHQERTWKQKDLENAPANTQVGQTKTGLHTHIHIIVSNRDKSQTITLNPNGQGLRAKKRFPILEWQKNNAKAFQDMFDYQHQTYFGKTPEEKIEAYLVRYNRNLKSQSQNQTPLQPQQIQKIIEEIGAEQVLKNLYKLQHAERNVQLTPQERELLLASSPTKNHKFVENQTESKQNQNQTLFNRLKRKHTEAQLEIDVIDDTTTDVQHDR